MPQIRTTINTQVVAGGMSFSPVKQTLEADGLVPVSRDIAANASNVEFTFAVPTLAAVKAFFLSCQKKTGETAEAGTMTVKTNDTSTPGNTWTIKQSSGVVWDIDNGEPIPIDAAITKLFVTNNGGAVMEFTAVAVVDATPGIS